MNIRHSMRSYLPLFKHELVSVAIFSMMTNLMMLAPTLYLLQLYDRVMLSKNELTLLSITLITCFFFVVMAFSEWVRSTSAIKAGVKFDQLLTSRLFRLGFAKNTQSAGQEANQAMQDLTFIRQFLTSNGLFAFFDMPWTLLYVAVLFILSPVLGVLAIILCIIQFGLALWNQRSSDQPLQQAGQARSTALQFIESKVRNIETLHVLGMLPHIRTRWQAVQNRWNQLDATAVQVQNRNQQINKFARYTMQSAMLGIAALLAVKGDISIGAMIASNVLIARALQPFDIIVSTWKQVIQARQSANKIDSLLASELHSEPDFGTPEIEIKGKLTLEQLTVTLENSGKTLLHNINLEIHPGQILGVMGPSGSGKTTLARCLIGVCPWQAGTLLVDGYPIANLPAQTYAKSIGYLPQDIALIEGTIADNIARFEQPDAAKVIQAAQAAGIHEGILRLPRGYDTRLDDTNAVLSGGQRQLVGLARAIYQQPAIIVLDEPNSHLDENGEASLLASLLLLKNQGKTIVIISHRSNILKITDVLLIMENGAVSHHGPRDEVIAELNQNKLNQAKQKLASKAA
ncbi:type I secretion system permease/ATPase [Methylobacillus gramineus]|uniref:type I secretion system permease/ATPase n=1 Tax=Methylobacillus gramineus TaxID=755169 RepID=UPI001CFFDA04|nr:type I secretion system permease/ATPase [Methylobacillus gramineus]MCB5183840.1 type I secretion system permease/ATPase [Methylobacillus gramineus]